MKSYQLVTILVLILLFAGPGHALGAPGQHPNLQQCLNVSVTSPRMNAIVRGNVEILGSASIDRFQFYKVEYSTIMEPDRWYAVSTTYNTPVINGRLDVWNTTVLPDGIYNLKLTVVDIAGQEPCRVVIPQIQVANAQPTETPTQEALPTPTRPPYADTPTIVVVQPPTPTVPRVVETPTPAPIPTRTPSPLPETKDLLEVFDVKRLGEAFLVGAGTTTAVFILLGFIALIRRLL